MSVPQASTSTAMAGLLHIITSHPALISFALSLSLPFSQFSTLVLVLLLLLLLQGLVLLSTASVTPPTSSRNSSAIYLSIYLSACMHTGTNQLPKPIGRRIFYEGICEARRNPNPPPDEIPCSPLHLGEEFYCPDRGRFCLTEAVNNMPLLSFSCVLQDLVRPITGGEEDTTAYGKQISPRIHHAYGNGPMSWKRAVICWCRGDSHQARGLRNLLKKGTPRVNPTFFFLFWCSSLRFRV